MGLGLGLGSGSGLGFAHLRRVGVEPLELHVPPEVQGDMGEI